MKFKIWCPELGMKSEDGKIMIEPCARIAATQWADQEDWRSNDYWIINGSGTIVCVQEEGSNEVQKFFVQGDMIRSYRAIPMGEEKI